MRIHPTRKQRKVLAMALALAITNVLFPQHANAEMTAPMGRYLAAAPALAKLPAVASVPAPVSLAKLPKVATVVPPAVRSMWVVVTAYSSTIDQTDGDPFTTASGAKVGDGIIAMNGVRFGTRVRFPSAFGTKEFVVMDRMNARMGTNHADIWMPSRADALRWGRRVVTIEFIK